MVSPWFPRKVLRRVPSAAMETKMGRKRKLSCISVIGAGGEDLWCDVCKTKRKRKCEYQDEFKLNESWRPGQQPRPSAAAATTSSDGADRRESRKRKAPGVFVQEELRDRTESSKKLRRAHKANDRACTTTRERQSGMPPPPPPPPSSPPEPPPPASASPSPSSDQGLERSVQPSSVAPQDNSATTSPSLRRALTAVGMYNRVSATPGGGKHVRFGEMHGEKKEVDDVDYDDSWIPVVHDACLTPGGGLHVSFEKNEGRERTLAAKRLFSDAFETGANETVEDDGRQTGSGSSPKRRKTSKKSQKKGRPPKKKSPGRPPEQRGEDLREALYARNRKKRKRATSNFAELILLSTARPLPNKRARDDGEEQNGRRKRGRRSDESADADASAPATSAAAPSSSDMDVDPSSAETTAHVAETTAHIDDSAVAPTPTAAEAPPSDSRLEQDTKVKYSLDLEKLLFASGAGSVEDTAHILEMFLSRAPVRQLPVVDLDAEKKCSQVTSISGEDRSTAVTMLAALRENLKKYRENNLKGGNYTTAEQQDLTSTLAMVVPRAPWERGLQRKLARAIDWDTGAGRKRLKLAGERKIDTREAASKSSSVLCAELTSAFGAGAKKESSATNVARTPTRDRSVNSTNGCVSILKTRTEFRLHRSMPKARRKTITHLGSDARSGMYTGQSIELTFDFGAGMTWTKTGGGSVVCRTVLISAQVMRYRECWPHTRFSVSMAINRTDF